MHTTEDSCRSQKVLHVYSDLMYNDWCLCLGYKGIQGIQASCIGEVLEVMVFVELCYIQVAIQGMLMSSHAKKKEIKEIKDGERKVQADACSVKKNKTKKVSQNRRGNIWKKRKTAINTKHILYRDERGIKEK